MDGCEGRGKEGRKAGRQAGRQGQPTVREQFVELHRLHSGWWRRLAWSHASSEELGDEAFAEAMLRICARLEELDEITPAYVVTTIRRVVSELEKKERKRLEGESEAALERLLHRVGPQRPDDFAARAELRGRLTAALGELPGEHRRVIELTVIEDMTQKAAAEELRRDRKTLRKRRDEALEMLHELLAP